VTPLRDVSFDFNGEDTSYLTHSIHAYPAKFPPQLPRKILSLFSQPGVRVLDPFCGSGTTLIEARLLGRDSVGVDINGLACLLAKVKSTPLSVKQQKLADAFLQTIQTATAQWRSGRKKKINIPEIEGLDHWFQKNVALELSFLRAAISELDDPDVKDFFRITLSSIIVRVSNQDSDTRFAAIPKNIKDGFTLKLFLERGADFLNRVREFSALVSNDARVTIYNADARHLPVLDTESFDLIITSPPYANTYDYYLYHKFRKRWLELDVKFAQYNEIGSRREFSSLKKKPQKWVEDLQRCFAEMARVLKCRKPAFIVIGDSVIQKKFLRMDEVIADFAPKFGFQIREIVSSDLSNHSKLFNPAFTQRGKKEHLIMLEKSNG